MSCSSHPRTLLSYPTCEVKCVSLSYLHRVSKLLKLEVYQAKNTCMINGFRTIQSLDYVTKLLKNDVLKQ